MSFSALEIKIFMVRSSFGLGIFHLREDIKNADILAYISIFLRTIGEKVQAKTNFSLRPTAERDSPFLGNIWCSVIFGVKCKMQNEGTGG